MHMRVQPRISGAGEDMVYRKGSLEDMKRSRRCATYGGAMSEMITNIPFPTAVASKILDDIGFNRIIDSSLDWDPKQCKISPGDAFKSIILSTASVKERPAIMNIEIEYQEAPLELLFDTVKESMDLGRFELSAHLDRLFEAGVDNVFMKVAAAARAHYNIVSKAAHADTTSVSVWGAYDSDYENDGGIDITKGYSKDKRPDLNQYMVGTVVNDIGVPIYSKPLDGNTSDVEWNRTCIDTIENILKREDLVYVADSKVVTEDLVRKLNDSDIRFLSRLPKNFGDNLQVKVLAQTDVGSLKHMDKRPEEKNRTDRHYTDMTVECNGMSLRLIPQVTSHNKGKGDKAVERERQSFQKALGAFVTMYNCMKDAQAAFARFEKTISKKYKMFRVSAEYKEFTAESRGRGRPRKDGTDVIREQMVHVGISYEEIPEVRDAVWKSGEFIVFVTNIPTREEDPVRGMDTEDVIRLYNNEWRVEGQFATLKKPAIADRLFLEKQSRAEALVSVFTMGVLVRGLMQLLIRRGIERIPDSDLPRYGVDHGPLQRNVTHAYFIQQFQGTCIHYFHRSREFTFGSTTVSARAEFFLNTMGIKPSELFSD